MQTNTWGYSEDGGSTYKPIPAFSSPATILSTTSANVTTAAIELTYGVKVDNSLTSGDYSNDIIYTLSAKPECSTYGITWNFNDGTAKEGATYPEVLVFGSTIDLTAITPTREGYNFTGWSNGTATFDGTETAVDINTENSAALTLTAQWTPKNYPISYDLGGGSVATANPASYTIETNTFTLNNPTRNGYTFAGWTGTNGTTKQTSVSIAKGSTGDKSYTANWTATNYTISYTMNGGSCSSYTNNYTIETNTFSLCTPTRNGYTFAGWTGSNGSTKQTSVSIAKGSTGNKSYTANWTAVNYTISYTLNSGSASNPTSYTIETNTFTLNNPTRSGYVFTGWGGTGLSGSANKTVTISKGSTGNRNYTANWRMQTMQEFSCTSISSGSSVTLLDSRDQNTYVIKKLADGKCWMTQNLRLVNKTISSSDSNLPSGDTWTIPASSTSGFDSYDANSAYYNGTTSGTYYTFHTATAGWGGRATSGNATKDICPKGWRLPIGGSSGEFQALYNKYPSSALMRGTPGFVLNGLDNYGSVYGFTSGYYWSSSVFSNERSYHLTLDSSSVSPAGATYKNNGFAVRCVAK